MTWKWKTLEAKIDRFIEATKPEPERPRYEFAYESKDGRLWCDYEGTEPFTPTPGATVVCWHVVNWSPEQGEAAQARYLEASR